LCDKTIASCTITMLVTSGNNWGAYVTHPRWAIKPAVQGIWRATTTMFTAGLQFPE